MLNDHLEEFDSRVIYRGKFNCCVPQSSKHVMKDRKFLGFTSDTEEEELRKHSVMYYPLPQFWIYEVLVFRGMQEILNYSEYFTAYNKVAMSKLFQVILNMRTNTLCWNPMEAFIFTAANEDYK